MRVIDADAHVVESERTWEFLDEAGLAPRVWCSKIIIKKAQPAVPVTSIG